MNSREELRRKGNEIRELLQHGTYPVRERPRATASIPGLRNFTGEAIFGGVWSRPGLDIRYRMLATLSVLTSLQRLSQFHTYCPASTILAELPSISFAGSPPLPGQCWLRPQQSRRAAVRRQSGSWGRQTPG